VKKRERLETIENAINIAGRAGISCQGFFIFGLPGETPETIEETINFAKNSSLSRAQFLILDVLPGSELWDTLRGKFRPDWAKNSFKEPEWIPDGLTRDQLSRAQSRAFRKFYSSRARVLRLAVSLKPGQLKYMARRLKDYRILGAKWSTRSSPGQRHVGASPDPHLAPHYCRPPCSS
jgi:radical SAM superfamily enzyme YgiQ (UPF0313 family)